jgi:uncharacterized protein involved in exopolysaccharide biosynthesis
MNWNICPRVIDPPPHAKATTPASGSKSRGLIQKLLHGFEPTSRIFRYFVIILVGALFFGSTSLAYYILTPRSYVSGFTLILPGSGAGSTANIEALGQVSSTTSSPFGSASLSPTQNYRRLLMSDRLRGEVAELSGRALSEVKTPRIQLVDQTQLIFVRVTDSDPDLAWLMARSWLTAFQSSLDELRHEEITTRDAAYRESVEAFEISVSQTRGRIIEFQAEFGLISLEQFGGHVANAETLGSEHREQLGQAQALGDRVDRLSTLIDLNPEIAASVMSLRGDPSFEAMRVALAESAATLASYDRIYGPNHPEHRAEMERYAGLLGGLATRGTAMLGLEAYGALTLADINLDADRAALAQEMISLAAEAAGVSAQAANLSRRLQASQQRVRELSGPAAQLDALLRAHQVAETVFSSALARLDASRTDIFTSYPMAQTLEQPTRPDMPTSPSRKIAALAAIIGFFVYLMGVIFLWLRLPLIRAVLKTS